MFKNKNINLLKVENSLFFLFVTYSLHILRNINIIFYILLFGLSYILLIKSYLIRISTKKTKIDILIFFFLFTMLFIPIISVINISFDEFLIGFFRFIPSLLFLASFALIYPKNYYLYYRILKFFVFFSVISSITLIIQFTLNINFDFLAEPSGREGLTRFTSLFGSLTSLGTLGPYSILTSILFFDKKNSFSRKNLLLLISIFIIAIASILSLQKAALINLIIVIVFILFFFISFKKSFIFSCITILSIAFVYLLFPNFFLFATFFSIFDYTFLNEFSNFFIDLSNRFYLYLDLFLISNNGRFDYYFLGAGFKASSGTLGLPNYVNFHNNFYELLFSGGILHLVSYLLVFIRTIIISLNLWIRSRNLTTKLISKFIFFSIVYFLINMLIGASTIYHPIGGSLIIIIIFFSKSNYRFINKS